MDCKKLLPAVVLTLGIAAQVSASAELFQMSEVSAHGTQLAAAPADSKCGAGSCGAAKPGEKKDAAHQCAGSKGEHQCGSGKKCVGKSAKACKKADHHCASAKKGDHHCAAKTGEHKCAAEKPAKP